MKKELNVTYTFSKSINIIFTKALLDIYKGNNEFIDKKFEQLKKEKSEIYGLLDKNQ